MRFARRLSVAFSAGALGGVANSIVVWLCGVQGITAAAGVRIAPALTKGWLYPRIVWGGIWGVVLLFPIIKKSHVLRGLVLSIAPTLVMLFLVFPSNGSGMMGLDLGKLTPAFVVGFNAVWGIAAGTWYGAAGGGGGK